MIFAILMILLSINQAQVVPAENSKVEFQHFQDVRNDLVDVRSATLTAGQNDVSQFPSVNLGTDYPPRILAANPPPASGTLQTSDAYDIIITDETDTTERIETRFLEYRPGYHELDVGSTWYENSMLYLDEREQSGLVVIEEQDLVPESGTDLRITALQNEYQESSSGRVTLELYPSETDDIANLTGELNVTLPTRLTADEYWTAAFEDEPAFDPTVENGPYPVGVQALNLTVKKENVTINTVGVQSMPEGKTAKENIGSTPPPPASEQTSLENTGETTNGDGQDTIEFSLKNEGDSPVTINRIAVNNTTADANTIKNGDQGEFEGGGGYLNTTNSIEIEGPAYPLNESATIAGGTTETFTLGEFQTTGNMKDENVTMTLYFDDDSSQQFTVAVPEDGGGGNDGPPAGTGP
ncbi:hypothetical protein [Halodesulfurarchaeum sp.]|uniref:hypothetical protein n=1 Tax=Halodesulfurarchaeum sp. TaxID=1980530 RepID=UPI002FC2C664